MTWFKVDDQLAFNMKVLSAGNAAMGLWVRAGSWSAAQLSDGVVPAPIVAALGGTPDDAAALVEAGLWHEDDGGWRFHDWAEYQPTRAQVLAERAATRERVAKHRAKRGGNDGGNGPGNADTSGERNGVTSGVGTDAPSRPVPSRPDDYSKTSMSQSRSKRASVSTDAVEVSEMTRRLAAQQGITDLGAVVALVAERLDRAITADVAYRLALDLLGRAKEHPKAPQRYIAACITSSPAEVQQRIDRAA